MVLAKRQQTLREHDAMRRSTCANCPAGCGVKVFLREGRLVDIVGDEEHPGNKGSLCPKGLLAYRHQAHPRRLLTPLVRARRAGTLCPVDWDEALALIAGRLDALERGLGAGSCHIHASAGSSFGHLLGGTVFARAYGTPNGPWRFRPAALGAGGAVARMLGVEADRLLSNSPRDWASSQCIVLYGVDPAATDPMTIGPVIDARERGVPVVVIDSRTTVTMSKASHALRVRPGTESVAMRGILRLLFDRDGVDEDFLREAVRGTDVLRAELQAYAPEVVARACEVPLPELCRVAEVIGAARPVQVISGSWLGPERFDDDDLRLAAALVALRGSFGIPGGGLNLLNASPFDWATLGAGEGQPARQSPLTLEALLASAAPAVGALFLEGDPCARLPGGFAARAAMGQLPFVAVLAAYENQSTRHADVVLPMASWLESDGLLANGNGRALQWHPQVLEPPGECRSALAFWTDLAQACGLGGRLPWHAAPAASRARAAADWALAANPWTGAASVSQLDPRHNPPGGLLWPCTEPAHLAFENSRFARGDVRGVNVLFQRNRAFPQASQRFPTGDGLIDLGAGPGAVRHAPDHPPTDALLLVPCIPVDHVEHYAGMGPAHAPGRSLPILDIHPRTAAGLGVGDGGVARVENDQGHFDGLVRITDTVAPHTIACIATPAIAAVTDGEPALSAWSLRAARDGRHAASCTVPVRIRPAGTPAGDRKGHAS